MNELSIKPISIKFSSYPLKNFLLNSSLVTLKHIPKVLFDSSVTNVFSSISISEPLVTIVSADGSCEIIISSSYGTFQGEIIYSNSSFSISSLACSNVIPTRSGTVL